MKTRQIAPEENSILKKYGIDLDTMHDCVACRYEAGEIIFSQGQPIEYLYIILQGKINVCMLAANGRDLTLCHFISSGILGDVELVMEDKAASATSIADLTSDCIRIPLFRNLELLTNSITFMNQVAKGLSMKLLNSSNALVSSALYSGEERLCTYILITEHHGMFTEVLSDVSKSIGISYRHLFRILSDLCQKSVLERRESGFLILDKQYLISKCTCR